MLADDKFCVCVCVFILCLGFSDGLSQSFDLMLRSSRPTTPIRTHAACSEGHLGGSDALEMTQCYWPQDFNLTHITSCLTEAEVVCARNLQDMSCFNRLTGEAL